MTVHRDALAAAQAKIAALEAALEDARAGTPSDESLRAEVARLEMLLSAAHAERRVAEDRAEQAEGELARLRREREDAERQARERDAAVRRTDREARSMLPLDEHNLARPLPTTPIARGAGVLCPACVERGERVELEHAGLAHHQRGIQMQIVCCMRCGHVGAKRAH